MPSSASFLLIVLCVLVLFTSSVSAFGAGQIPDFAYLNDKAFRHLDIENILENIVRWTGSRAGGGLMGIISSAVSGEKKFTKADVQRIYFGNWLRDYSQAMDIAGLSKATSETIILLLSVLSFMTFGYGTEEFQLMAEKLGVYLPVEHIDNPKGYGGEEDPRKYHPKLRPPVDPRELEIDPRTGMKNYIANDGQGWDTSAAHVRRSLEKVIQLARQAGGHRSPELYEAYRLMGGALHTLEDLLAHSNWIELSLNKMGYRDVFTHVGDSMTVNAPGGQRVPPLVTGTFGSADFIFSVMGEAGDKLSESSVSELSKKVSAAQGQEGTLSTIKNVISQVPSGGEDTQDDMQKADEIQKKAYSFDPDNYTTDEVQQTLWEILVWRDTIMRKISTIIEKIPGMETVLDQLTEALNVYIYTTIEPYVKPVLGTASNALGAGSRLVIDQDDQYEVFNNSNASDPSHSMVSKDHFDNILNEPAGKIAKVVVEVAVNKIVAAWSDESVDVRHTIDEILSAFHHPYFADERSEMQMAMAQTVKKWFDGLGNGRNETLSRLSKESVRDGKNKRLGADDSAIMHSHAIGASSHGSGHGPSYNAPYSGGPGHHPSTQGGRQQAQTGYGAPQEGNRRQEGSHKDHTLSYGRQEQTSGYGRSDQSQGYRQQETTRYGQQESRYGREEETGRGQGRTGYGREEDEAYGQKKGYSDQEQDSYGRFAGHEPQPRDAYGQQETTGYGQGNSGGAGYQSNRREEEPSYGQSGYGDSGGRHTQETGYGQSRYGGSGNPRRGQDAEYGQETGGYGDRSSKRGDDDTYGVDRLNLGGGGSRAYEGGESRGYGGGESHGYGDRSGRGGDSDDNNDDDDHKKKKQHRKRDDSD